MKTFRAFQDFRFGISSQLPFLLIVPHQPFYSHLSLGTGWPTVCTNYDFLFLLDSKNTWSCLHTSSGSHLLLHIQECIVRDRMRGPSLTTTATEGQGRTSRRWSNWPQKVIEKRPLPGESSQKPGKGHLSTHAIIFSRRFLSSYWAFILIDLAQPCCLPFWIAFFVSFSYSFNGSYLVSILPLFMKLEI